MLEFMLGRHPFTYPPPPHHLPPPGTGKGWNSLLCIATKNGFLEVDDDAMYSAYMQRPQDKTKCGGPCGERQQTNPFLHQINPENPKTTDRPLALPDVLSLHGEPTGVVGADALEGAGHQDRAVAGQDGGVVAGLVADGVAMANSHEDDDDDDGNDNGNDGNDGINKPF